MKKAFLTSTILVVAVLVGLLFSLRITNRGKLTVQSVGEKGIFVGDQELAQSGQQTSTIHPKLLQEQEKHQSDLRAIDEAWDNIGVGDSHFKAGHYEEAAMAYERAYSSGGGSRAVSGLLLAATYEKLGRYDDGITLLEEMIQRGYLSQKGIENANEIRARLLAAKEKEKEKVPGTELGDR